MSRSPRRNSRGATVSVAIGEVAQSGFGLPISRSPSFCLRRLGVTPYRLAGRSLRAGCRAVAAVPASSPAYGRRAKLGSHAFGVRAGGPDEHRPTEVGQGKMAGCHVSREVGHIRRLNGRGNPEPPRLEARGVSRRECASCFATGASSRLAPRAFVEEASGSPCPGRRRYSPAKPFSREQPASCRCSLCQPPSAGDHPGLRP
jgi:hypothetical protein